MNHLFNKAISITIIMLFIPTIISADWTLKKGDSAKNNVTLELTEEVAFNFSKLALKCVHKEYPNKTGHVMNSAEEVLNPKALHPAFYGCFDWHSSVHGHWMLIKLLKTFPGIRNGAQIRAALSQNISAENILKEVAYFKQPGRKSFERTYGWAWLLKLAEELHGWEDEDGIKWAKNLKPLEKEIVSRYFSFLPKQTYPIRTGVHPNTAFGIAFALDYSRAVGNKRFENLLIATSHRYFLNDRDYPSQYEPGGEDFFSPALMEASLMRRTLDKKQYWSWIDVFLPKRPDSLLKPATVTDRTDPKIIHLDGLNLSRAWCLYSIVSHLPSRGVGREMLLRVADDHLRDALANITSGSYEGEHWLASFAVYALAEKIECLKTIEEESKKVKPDTQER